MKKFFVISVLILSLVLFVSCEEDKKISNYDGSETNDTDATDTDATDATDTDATDTDATDTDATDTDATDTDTTDTDATDTDTTDTDATDTDTTDTDTGIVTECEKLVFTDAESYENEIYSSIYIEETDEFPFYLSITFYDYFMNEDNEPDFAAKTDIIDLKGETVTLGEGANTNLATCTECVLLYSDPNEEGNYTKAYLAKSGTLFFEDVEAGTVNSKGNGSFLLFEVTIDDNDISTYVEGGKCYEVSPFEWDTMGDTPVDPTEEECLPLSLEEMFMETMASDDGEYTSYFAYLVGDEIREYRSYIEMNFYDSMSESGFKTDLYDLVDTFIYFDDTDFNNCETCLKLNYAVYNEAGEYENTFTYYPVEGYITFSNAVEETMLSAGYGEDIKFVEVYMDPETEQLVPMEGGKCFTLPSLEWDFVTEESECSINEDCEAGEICEEGVCVYTGEYTCSINDDCFEYDPDFMCIDGYCAYPECLSNEDCAEGEICTDGVCEVAGELECYSDEECIEMYGDDTMVCTGGVCESGMVEPECYSDEDCGDGFCLENHCEYLD